MEETVLNIYLIIEAGYVTSLRAKEYMISGDDEEKTSFLKLHAKDDFENAEVFNAPTNKLNQYMKYSKFSLLEKNGMHFKLFEPIFLNYEIPENPLICVTPVVDGKIIVSEENNN